MKSALVLLLAVTFFQQVTWAAAELVVKADTITIAGASLVETDTVGTSGITAIYGGVAGTCATSTGSSTCNSCTSATTLRACNQTSIYPTLAFTVSFRSTKDLPSATGKLSIMTSAGVETVPIPTVQQVYVANSTVATASTTWATICSAAGLGSDCKTGSSGVYAAKIGLVLDSDNNNSFDPTEMKSIDVRIHYISDGDSTLTSNRYCAAATTAGACSIKFVPGDEKVYIDEPKVGASEAANINFDAIVIFPVPVNPANDTNKLSTISGFTPNKVASPNVRPMTISTDSKLNIENSEITGGLQNYQTYCFIYGTRNKAQNIYHFVTASPDATLATNICIAPSEVVGLLADKHCFISTAAFGSDMAQEVQIFRKFRNQFLLTNELGTGFVKAYYKFGPLVANVIAGNETLRSMTRTALYPALGFSYIALNYGILAAFLALLVIFILIFKIKSVVKQKKLLLFLIILIFVPSLKAQIVPNTKVIQHPEAQEGLVRITKDGTYVYDLHRQMKSESSRITFGHALEPEVSIDIEQRNPTTGAGTGVFQTFNFGDLYEETSSFILGYDYEKFIWVGRQGKLGYQLGGAFMYAQGHGRLQSTLEPSREKYTFLTLPLMAGAVYRMEWKDKQLFAPFVAGGGTYTALLEKREDKSTPQYTGAPGFYAAGGVLTNVGYLDEESSYALESEYGISNLWVSLEYKLIEVDASSFTFSDRYVNLGVAFDF